MAGDVLHDLGQGGLAALELLPRHGADGDQGDEAVDRGDDQQREHDRAGQVLLRVLGFLTCGGCRVEADVREEEHGRGGTDGGDAERGQRGVVAGLDAHEADDDEEDQRHDLDGDHDRVDPGALLGSAEQEDHAQEHHDEGGEVDVAALAQRGGEALGDGEAERAVEQLVEVLAPADGDGRDGDAVLQDQAPAADPGYELAHGGVGVGVRGARDGDGARELGVGERREQRGQARDDEGDEDGRTGDRGGLAEDDEDAGAQGRADADHGQLPHGERTLQRAALTLAAFGDQLLDRLAAEQRVGGPTGLGSERWRLAVVEHEGTPCHCGSTEVGDEASTATVRSRTGPDEGRAWHGGPPSRRSAPLHVQRVSLRAE